MLGTIDFKTEQGNVFYLVSKMKELSSIVDCDFKNIMKEININPRKKNVHKIFKRYFGEFINIIE